MDYNEILLQAIDTVVGSRLQGLLFDKTVKAQIVEDLGNGTYRVKENDAVKYLAIAEGAYSVNEWVYVTIPQGDTSATKIIVGKYTDVLEAEPMVYVTELDSFMPLTETAFSKESEYSLVANGSEEKDKRQYVQIGSTIILADSSNIRLKYNSAYNTIGLSCKFKTWFSDLEMLSGTYGLQVRIATHDGQVYIADLDSSTMFGDPYGYTTYFDQGCTIDISNLTTIDAVGIYLYQDNSFRYLKDGKIETYEFPQDGAVWFDSNIYVKDIKIQLGEDILAVDNHTVKLVSDDASSTYGEEDTTKSISLIWYNKDSAGRLIGYQDGIYAPDYDEDNYAKELEDEYYGGFVKIDGLAPLKDAYACYYKGKQMATHIEEAEAVLKKVYQNIIKVAVNYYIGAGKTNGQMSALKDEFDWDGGKGYYDQVFLGLTNRYSQDIADWGKELAELYSGEDSTEDVEGSAEDVEWKELSILNAADNLRLPSLWTKLVSCLKEDRNTTKETAYYDQLISLVTDYRKEYNSCGKAIMDCYNSNGKDETNAGSSAKGRYNSCIAAIANAADVSKLKTFEEEYEEFKEANKNRYCIYWYKANGEASGDSWLGDGWERLDGARYPDAEGEEYTDYNRPSYQAEMDIENSSTSFKGIIFFNHEQFESNILKFDNTVIQQDMPEDLGTGLVICHGLNSRDHYQSYGDDYCILQSSDAYQTRLLEVKHNGTEYGNKIFTGNYLFWYIPETLTMISPASPTSSGFAVLKKAYTTAQKAMLDPTNEAYDEEYAKLQARLRSGYTCYYKVVGESESVEAIAADDENWDTEEKVLGEPKASDLQFPYRIKNVYNPSYINNEIRCVLNYGDYDYEAKIAFTFATYGTCGTGYTLALAPVGAQTSINIDDEDSVLSLQAVLLNSNSEAENVAFSASMNGKPLSSLSPDEETKIYSFDANRLIDRDNCYNIFTVSSTIDDIKLSASYPIPLSWDNQYLLAGTSRIVYDASTSKPSTSNNTEAYVLYKYNEDGSITEVEDKVTFELWYITDKGQWVSEGGDAYKSKKDLIGSLEGLELDKEQKFAVLGEPTLVKGFSSYYLRPASMYMSGSANCVVVARISGKCVFAQPIYVYLNRWNSSLLNGWDGNLKIDEEGNYILTSMLGAGIKENDNSFSGVVLGDLANAGTSVIGLYGYSCGKPSFGFRVDGTAFIGEGSAGQINFDGSSGTITSGNYSKTNDGQLEAGTKIDLKEGLIEAKNFELNAWSDSGGLYLSSAENRDYGYFKVGTKGSYLQYTSSGLNIQGGTISNGECTISSEGKIVAKSGNIGGWELSENGFSSEDSASQIVSNDSVVIGVFVQSAEEGKENLEYGRILGGEITSETKIVEIVDRGFSVTPSRDGLSLCYCSKIEYFQRQEKGSTVWENIGSNTLDSSYEDAVSWEIWSNHQGVTFYKDKTAEFWEKYTGLKMRVTFQIAPPFCVTEQGSAIISRGIIFPEVYFGSTNYTVGDVNNLLNELQDLKERIAKLEATL